MEQETEKDIYSWRITSRVLNNFQQRWRIKEKEKIWNLLLISERRAAEIRHCPVKEDKRVSCKTETWQQQKLQEAEEEGEEGHWIPLLPRERIQELWKQKELKIIEVTSWNSAVIEAERDGQRGMGRRQLMGFWRSETAQRPVGWWVPMSRC